jgi:hypothetical protein
MADFIAIENKLFERIGCVTTTTSILLEWLGMCMCLLDLHLPM